MAKRTWDDAIKRGLEAAAHKDRYAYFYGAKGQVLTKATMDALWAAEPAYFKKYTAEEKAQIYKNSLNKIGYDCSGFTGWICTGDKEYSKAQMANSVPNKSLADGPAGSILFTTFGGKGRHIGIDIGYGFFLHMGYESTDRRVAENTDSVALGRIKEFEWEQSGMSNVIDYTGATNR